MEIILHKHKEGDLITLRKPGATLCTLAIPQQGSYKVIRYHQNGSITTKFEPDVVGRVNVRHCHPCKTDQTTKGQKWVVHKCSHY